jgi:DNA-binding response OmpR family regulator
MLMMREIQLEDRTDYCEGCGRPHDEELMTVSHDGIEINLSRRQYLIDGKPFRLTHQQAQFLFFLIARKRVSRTQLIMNIIPESEDPNNHISVIVCRTKGVLKSLGRPDFIKTIWGWGYELGAAAA